MSSRLQLDMRNLSLGKRHLVNAYDVEAGIGVIADNTVWSMPERLECEVPVLQKARYINTLTFTFTLAQSWIGEAITLFTNGVNRILRQEGHGMHVHEIRHKSQKLLHKYNKLTLSQLSDCESVAGT